MGSPEMGNTVNSAKAIILRNSVNNNLRLKIKKVSLAHEIRFSILFQIKDLQCFRSVHFTQNPDPGGKK